MADDSFFEEDSRLLGPNAFEFVLDGELKRAVRSQNFLTLVTLETCREWDGMSVAADEGTVENLAHVVRHEVRDTDLLGYAPDGMLALVLLDADYQNSTKVIDRLVQRMDSTQFPSPLRISMGAACYPTHAVDAVSLKRQALSRPVVNWRGGTKARESGEEHQ
ncbi:MAG TPA: hypothetical protein VM364_20450 [Vicinamibacterales bacterium]|nr:hypothetical protein [Vicinamibacterales bacterium]